MRFFIPGLRIFRKAAVRFPAGDEPDGRVRELFDLIHHTEAIASKLHGIKTGTDVFLLIEKELGELSKNNTVILMLSDDKKKAHIKSFVMPSNLIKKIDEVMGSKGRNLVIDVEHSSVLRRAAYEGETYSIPSIELFKEFLPQPVSIVIAGITGHDKKTTILSPLTVRGEVIGIFGIDSHEMVDVFILSVKNLARHISAALELAEQEKRRDSIEKKLVESREKYRRIVESLQNEYFFYSHDTDGVFTYLSPSVTNILGYTIEEFSAHFSKYLTGDPVNGLCIAHSEASIQGIPQPPYDVDIFHKNGSIRRLEVTEIPVFDEQRRVIAIEGIAHDVTKRRYAEKTIQQKEAALSGIFMAAPVGISVVSDRTLVAINRHISEITGYDREELINRNARIFFENDEEYDRIGRELYGNLSQKGYSCVEAKMKRKDGRMIDVLLTAAPIEGADQSVVTLTDITAHMQMERERIESERNFRRMFEITSEGVALISTKTGRFVDANPAMCALFGYSENEFRSLTPEDITPEEAKNIMREAMLALSEGRNVPDHEGISVRKDGTKVNVIVSNRRMSWNGEPAYHVTFQNISYLKEIQEQLRKKNLEILDFTNMVTHDLRKPLTAMNIIFELAAKGAFGRLTADGAEAIGTGLEAAKYMQEMLEDLMACARLEAGTQELEIVEVGFGELAATVASHLKFQLEEKSIALELPREDTTVNSDKKYLTRVLMNLVGNAVNYIGNGPGKYIRIDWERRNGAKIFFVQDNGMGIPLESQQHLFEKFSRGSNVSGIAGTGLGLAIVKGIVEAHGGKIWFESEVGDGTTFFFTLGG